MKTLPAVNNSDITAAPVRTSRSPSVWISSPVHEAFVGKITLEHQNQHSDDDNYANEFDCINRWGSHKLRRRIQFFLDVLSGFDSHVAEIVFIFLTLNCPLEGTSVTIEAGASSFVAGALEGTAAGVSSIVPVIFTLCPACTSRFGVATS